MLYSEAESDEESETAETEDVSQYPTVCRVARVHCRKSWW